MMNLRTPTSGIYRQIADYGLEQILSGEWTEGLKIPSVRQLAAEIGVNPNTVMSAYEELKHCEVIVTQRGRGYYVANDGRLRAIALRRNAFVREELPQLRRNLELLNISPEELTQLLNDQPQSQNS